MELKMENVTQVYSAPDGLARQVDAKLLFMQAAEFA